MTSIDFAKHLHQPFQLQIDPLLTMSLGLAAVQDASFPQGETSFAVIFQGPQAPILPARTYQLSHPRLGKFELRLSPLERRTMGMCYKAVVSSPA
ncbi:MAG: hypothetical protein KF832_06055 [Caldilineaceae bacterium]|nr:hypothetical protein [Caldilineaceae bacterium]